MKRKFFIFMSMTISLFLALGRFSPAQAANEVTIGTQADIQATQIEDPSAYILGVDDMLDLNILQPEQIISVVTVSPDGTINVPYVGSVKVAGLSLTAAQELIRSKLSDGYLQYPVVSLALKQNRSKNFFVYGEVMKPGAYLLADNTTALKAITMAGGFTKFGSPGRVKILRPKKDGKEGYQTIKANLSAAMAGNSKYDIKLEPGDMVIVSEGIF